MAQHFTDALGNSSANFKTQPRRIVSLVPSQTELLYDLGLENEVVGITKFCIHPDSWFRTKTRIGGTKTINLEKIRQLKPDLILANKEENIQEQVMALAHEFPIWVTDVKNMEDALDMISAVGQLTGKQPQAKVIQNEIARAFENIKRNNIRKLRTAYLIWKDPYLTIGGDTFIHAVLKKAQFQNLMSDLKRYPEISIDTLSALQCELLLLSSEPYPFTEKHIQELQPLLPNTIIKLVDGSLFSWYGSRLKKTPAYIQSLHEDLQKEGLIR